MSRCGEDIRDDDGVTRTSLHAVFLDSFLEVVFLFGVFIYRLLFQYLFWLGS